jgi:hypothetical protein
LVSKFPKKRRGRCQKEITTNYDLKRIVKNKSNWVATACLENITVNL